MKVPSFLRLFGQRWLSGSGRRKARRAGAEAARRARRHLPQLDPLEDRTLLATPAPQVMFQTALPGLVGQGSTPSVAVDPLNPLRAVAVFNGLTRPQGQPPTARIGGAFTSNGGQTWSQFIPDPFFGTAKVTRDPTSNPMNPTAHVQVSDASVSFDRTGNFYVLRLEHDDARPYNQNGALILEKYNFSSGVPVKIILPGEVPCFGLGDPCGRVIYQWTQQDPVIAPILVVDNTLATFTDPDTGLVQSNPSAGTIYVAFGSNDTPPPNTMNFNGNSIRLLASSDGGNSWGATSFPTGGRGTFETSPRLTVSQGTADGRVRGGQLLMTWVNFASSGDPPMRPEDRFSTIVTQGLERGVGLGFAGVLPDGVPFALLDALNTGMVHTPQPTVIPINVNITHQGFVSLRDLEVTLSLSHANLSELLIEVITPTGEIINLVTNRTFSNGMQRQGNPAPGITGANLGWDDGTPMGTRFDVDAVRAINNGPAAPFAQRLRPEFPLQLGGITLDAVRGRTAAQLNGQWFLRVTDMRNSPPMGNTPPQLIYWAELHMSSGMAPIPGTARGVFNLLLGSNLSPYPGIVRGNNAPARPSVYPDHGFLSAPVVASDNTLGSFSPHQGRIYLAYVDYIRVRNARNEDLNPIDGQGNFRSTNTDIFLVFTDNGGVSWSPVPRQVNDDDTFQGIGSDGTLTTAGPGETLGQTGRTDAFGFPIRPAGGLPQFLPEIVVDQATGTVAVSFLDARHDPEGKRVATYVTYSVDGGQTFSPQVFVNAPRTARDAATGRDVLIEPFLDNQSSGHPRREDVYGFGQRLGLALHQGRMYSAWSGNQNLGRDADSSAGLSIFAAVSTIPGGPRIINSTMGPVKATTVPGTGVTFNNTFAPDGTRLANAFYIEFDRPIDPSTFNADTVSVIFRTPTTPATAPGILLDVFTVLPLNAGLFGPAMAPGATRFLVQFDPTKALSIGGTYVGTYSYAIRPLVRDRIRLAGVNVMPGATFNFASQPPENNLRLPPVGTGGSGIVANDLTRSRITVGGLPANQQITKITVTVNILHTFDFDLELTLVAPDGTRTLLSFLNGGSGDNYTNTTFDDDALIPIFFGTAPFTGRFRPDDPAGLRKLIGRNPNGVWALEVRDFFLEDSGTLQNWSLNIQTGIVSIGITQLGNRMDQNSNGVYGEDPGDTYATPRPLAGTPFRPPYDQTTSPLIVTGPTIVSTRVPGNPQTLDNLILNGAASALDIVFDRDMDPASLTPAQIVRLMGPAGLIIGPFTITANPAGTDPSLARRTFRIGFPAQQISGTYVVTLASSIRSAAGDAMDVNQNAGLDVVRDTASAGSTNAGVQFRSGTPVDLLPRKTVDAFLDVPENFVLQGVQLRLNITTTDAPNLTATLIAPDGAEVRLFTRVGQGGASRTNFTNTTFDDNAAAPIQRATAPFFGSFTPQQPLSRLQNRPAGGRWRLRIENNSAGASGRLTDWTLTLFKAVPNSGLGELAADQATVSFRIFTLSNATAVSKTSWTAIGPAPIGPGGNSVNQNDGSRTGRIGGLALDPSDPSGNTVYVAGASGGVWKTRNFLTTNISGPTYIPLTDFGPSFGTNIGGLASFGRNNDPNQTVVFAGTGEGDTASRGVGFLRSFDGGATWTVLNSTNNVDASGNPLPISSALRDNIFVGTTVFKVVVDPKATPSGDVIVYAAVSDITGQDVTNNRAGGIWRSLNSGRNWQRMRVGQATDVVLLPHSADGITGNLGIVYGAFRGQGVFLSPNQGQVWNLMTGTVGNPLIRDGDGNPPDSIPVNAGPAPNTPNGAKGRIVLAVPEVTGNRAQDLVYAGFLYAFVATPVGRYDGLYLTKDFGQNWTRVRVPLYREPTLNAGAPSSVVVPSIDPRLADNDVFASEGSGQGNYDLSLVVDPTNPNVVYVGGADAEGAARSPVRLMRVDTTVMLDPHAYIGFSSHNVDGGGLLQAGIGGITLKDTRAPFILRLVSEGAIYQSLINFPHINLVRDPNNVFLNDSLMLMLNVQNWTNTGADARWRPFVDVLDGSVDQHRVFAFRDPATGKARLVFGDDQGVFSGVDDGQGNLLRELGGTVLATGSRNGNLQITQFYSGAAQPSILAAEIAGSLFYGTNQDTGNPKSTADSLRTGNLVWRGVGGDGTGLATDQTGSGNAYAYLWPCCGGGPGPGFFRFTPPGTDPLSPGIARTFGLLQENQPGDTPDPQWPFAGGFNIAINPINGNQGIISGAGIEFGVTNHGRVFRTRDAGLTWFQIGDTADLDGFNAQALAYGAPDPRAPQVGNFDDFIYAGTVGGRIFVTFTGGGGVAGNRWKDISQGLDGSPVQVIVTNPNRGSREAYAVTSRGVYFMADSSVVNAGWQNITGNLLSVTHDPFGDRTLRETRMKDITSLAADWRYQLPNNGQAGRKFPVLYVGGEGGVFRSINAGSTWTSYPDTTEGAVVAGGYLPNARVTDLDLVLGNINPTTGLPDQSAGFNMLVASTFGRGAFAIRLTEVPGITPFPGPRVVAVDATAPVSPGFNAITVTFSGPVDPETFTIASIRSFIGPNGTVNVTSVQDLQDPVTRLPAHTTYRITFTGLQLDGVYTLIFGPNLTDFGGNALNQNGNTVNGEEPSDRFTIRFVINTSDNGRFVTGLFNDLLLRRSDTEGFLQFIDPVDAARAQALGPVARLFSASAEARALLIASYYSSTSPTVIGNFLRRAATPAEINTWVQFLQAGGTPMGVVNAIVSSVEYFQLAGGSDLAFLTRLYTDLLARGIDAAGRDSLLALLNQLSGGARASIINALNHSGEYYAGLVSGFYTKFLGRAASANDIAFWVPRLAGGATVESVIAAIAGSDEYFQRRGGNNSAFVDGIFSDILGRGIDPATRAALLGQLAGASRQAVAAGLLVSDEYRGNLVRGYYTKFLGRTPAQGEVDGWVAALRAGFSDEAVITSIMASDEYLARTGGTSQSFVDRAYLDLLGRAADAAGRAGFLLSLAQSQSGARANVASLFTSSPEYLTRIIVTTYQTYLRRGAGSADINVWLPLLSSKPAGTPGAVSPQEQFVGHVLGSGEYFQLNGNTNRSWVASLYTNFLRRSGGAAEIDTVLGAVLDFYTGQRQAVATTVSTSTEARQAFILSQYSTLLRRSPLDQEVAVWITLFQNGLREEQMTSVIMGSAEYFQRQANNNVTQYIDKAYQDLLGRARGATETTLLNLLLAGTITRQQAGDAILVSIEYRRRVIGGFYRTYLNREGTLPDIDALAARVAAGARYSEVLATILGSREYFLATHPYP